MNPVFSATSVNTNSLGAHYSPSCFFVLYFWWWMAQFVVNGYQPGVFPFLLLFIYLFIHFLLYLIGWHLVRDPWHPDYFKRWCFVIYAPVWISFMFFKN